MQLARGILAWLPLGQLTWELTPTELDALAPVRAQLVNERPLAAMLAVWAEIWPEAADYPLWLKYAAVSTYQGELSDLGPIFLPVALLQARAAVLGQGLHYRNFSAMNGRVHTNFAWQTALASDQPVLQAAALQYSHIEPEWLAPETLRPGLRRALRAIGARDFYWPGEDDFIDKEEHLREPAYVAEWLQYLSNQTEDGQLPISKEDLRSMRAGARPVSADNFFIAHGMTNTLPTSKLSPTEIMQRALDAVQPTVVRWVLQHYLQATGSVWASNPAPRMVSAEFQVRARKMLALLLENQTRLFVSSMYEACLQAITGQPIPMKVMSYYESNYLTDFLWSTAHPQATIPTEQVGPLRSWDESVVHFDLPNLLQRATSCEMTLSLRDLAVVHARQPTFYSGLIARSIRKHCREPWFWWGQTAPEPGETQDLICVAALRLRRKYGRALPEGYSVRGAYELELAEKLFAYSASPEQKEAAARERERWAELLALLEQ